MSDAGHRIFRYILDQELFENAGMAEKKERRIWNVLKN